MRYRRVFRSLAMLSACVCFASSMKGGPPFRTDDPEPVELGHSEVYLAGIRSISAAGSSGSIPLVEFNDGIYRDTQFHIVLPLAFSKLDGEPTQRGYGDTEIGLKARLLHESDGLPQIGIFPLVELPTGSAGRGLGAGHTQVYLPVWLQKSWGKWTSYGGTGWWRNPGDGQRDWTYAGWLIQRDLSERVILGAELFRTTAISVQGRSSTGFTVGGIVNLTAEHHLLLSAGRAVNGERNSQIYLGYQRTLDRGWVFGRAGHPPE